MQLEDYGQVRDSVQAYASGSVRIWIGTSYTTYGLYEVIPQVGLPGPSLGQALPSSRLIKSQSKVEHSPLAIQVMDQSTGMQ